MKHYKYEVFLAMFICVTLLEGKKGESIGKGLRSSALHNELSFYMKILIWLLVKFPNEATKVGYTTAYQRSTHFYPLLVKMFLWGICSCFKFSSLEFAVPMTWDSGTIGQGSCKGEGNKGLSPKKRGVKARGKGLRNGLCSAWRSERWEHLIRRQVDGKTA